MDHTGSDEPSDAQRDEEDVQTFYVVCGLSATFALLVAAMVLAFIASNTPSHDSSDL